MTTRILNKSRFKIILEEYTADLATESPHPIRYILYDRKFGLDIIYEIKQPIDTATLQPLKFVRNINEGGYKTYENVTFVKATNTAVLSTEEVTKGVASATRVSDQAGQTIKALADTLAEAAQAAAQIVASAGQQAG